MRRLGLSLFAAAVLAGCGNSRTQPVDVIHADPPQGQRDVALTKAGVRFTAPANWADLAPQGARVGGIQSKTATLAVWRYERTEPLPATEAALDEVKGLLEARVKLRDPDFVLRTSEVRRRAGAHAIELVGRQTIAGRRFDVRSSHVYKDGVEVVVDAYAPPDDFARVDATVFQPVLRSLRIRRP